MQRAAVAARGLREDAHHGKKYLLSGPESLTLVEQVQTIAEEIGRLVESRVRFLTLRLFQNVVQR